MRDRAARLEQLRRMEFDLLIVGGGATGAAIARDAALRGLTVALVEQGDLAQGTSSASSKLIHGGLRYLEHFEFGLVFEGTSERALLMHMAPHLARPLPFLFPVYTGRRVGMLQLAAGMWTYDILAMFRNYRRHRMLSRGRTRRAEPALQKKGLRGSARYYDCMTDDARLTVETALSAAEERAVIVPYAEAVELVNDGTRTAGAWVRDLLAPDALAGDPASVEPIHVRARVTVVAAGPWSDRVLGPWVGRTLLRPTKGSHIVFDHERLPVQNAVVVIGPSDGRVMFVIPWGTRTIVGTTDTDEGEGPDGLEASTGDVRYLLETVNAYFPSFEGTFDDVISTWAGLRPLMASDSESESAVSREHEIINVDPGLLAIVGGKLTTYRLMGEQVVDDALRKLGVGRALEPCRTRSTPLPGAKGLSKPADVDKLAASLAEEYALDADVANRLATAYGARAPEVLKAGKEADVRPGRLVSDLPVLVDEVAFAVKHDLAYRLDDVLRRRTPIFLKDRDQGLGCCEEAARIMADLLDWDADRTTLEVERYRAKVAASRRFRTDG